MTLLNINRFLVLLAARVTGFRGETPHRRWQISAAMPREHWSELSQLLLLASTTVAILLAFPSTILLGGWSSWLAGRALLYGLPAAPLVCGFLGSLECEIRKMREPDRVLTEAILTTRPVPERLDIRSNRRLLLPSSVAGLLLAVAVAVILASVDPLDFGT